ncbi:hypothetical protein JCM10213_001633 [Rhodosporidiobolus nylandii]
MPTAATDDAPTRWFLLYGAHIYPARLAALLAGAKPLQSSTVAAQGAFLSFDVPGVPFLEPTYASALVQGVNDAGEWEEGGKGRESEEYRRWIWERCCPGMQFEGELPPFLEGIAYELTHSDYARVVAATVAASPTAPSALVRVRCTRFRDGDLSDMQGEVQAEMLVAKLERRPAGLQPTQQCVTFPPHVLVLSFPFFRSPDAALKYLALVGRGAFLNALSLRYLSYLTLLRPYTPTTRSKRLLRTLTRLLLLPSFLLFHLPSRLLGWPAWARFGALLLGTGARRVKALEWCVRGVVGSGWLNEDDHKAARGLKQ